MKSLSCVQLCDPIDCSLPGFSIHGIFQARVLEWVAIALSDMCVCVYIYIYIYIYTHTHTHTCIYIYFWTVYSDILIYLFTLFLVLSGFIYCNFIKYILYSCLLLTEVLYFGF